jgi:hypothetical protein
VDAVIPLLGFHSDLGAIREWGATPSSASERTAAPPRPAPGDRARSP